jgi:hypothetical protein
LRCRNLCDTAAMTKTPQTPPVASEAGAHTRTVPALGAVGEGAAVVASPVREVGGREGPEPTRFGDWERAGRCIDF